MKRFIFPILGILSMTVLATFLYLEKREEEKGANSVDPERQAACEQFLTVALFPDNGAADEFMEACLKGEPVLPGEFPNSGELPDESTPSEPIVGGVENSGPVASPNCAVGGCSNQVCGEAGEVENVVTTCEYREEYACYAHAKCERQTNGRCGWTETTGYTQCRADLTS